MVVLDDDTDVASISVDYCAELDIKKWKFLDPIVQRQSEEIRLSLLCLMHHWLVIMIDFV